MRALGRRLFKQLRVKLSHSNVFRLLPGNSLTLLSGPKLIIRYKILINALTYSVKTTSEAFNDIVNYKQYRKLIQKVSKRSVNKQVSFENAAAAATTDPSADNVAAAAASNDAWTTERRYNVCNVM